MPRRTKVQIEAANKRKLTARKARLLKVHHMTLEQYEGLKDFQGGKCYMCQWATGKSRSLAVDHDHNRAKEMCDHDPHTESCINCWRGLLCSACNGILRTARDTIEFFKRGIDYLTNPPARRFFKKE
jgi:hypothetical protein